VAVAVAEEPNAPRTSEASRGAGNPASLVHEAQPGRERLEVPAAAAALVVAVGRADDPPQEQRAHGPALPPLLCPCPSSPLGLPRWRLQRKEPGWFVGEQRHVSLAGGALLVVVASGADLEEGVEAMCFLVCAGGRPFPCCVRPAGCLLYTQRRYCSTREDTAACDCFPVLGLIRVELPRGRWQVVPHN
jgi:hypothetical protein